MCGCSVSNAATAAAASLASLVCLPATNSAPHAFAQTLTTYTRLLGDEPAAVVMASQPLTPYEVLRGQINEYMAANPAARLYVTGHSLGAQLFCNQQLLRWGATGGCRSAQHSATSHTASQRLSAMHRMQARRARRTQQSRKTNPYVCMHVPRAPMTAMQAESSNDGSVQANAHACRQQAGWQAAALCGGGLAIAAC